MNKLSLLHSGPLPPNLMAEKGPLSSEQTLSLLCYVSRAPVVVPTLGGLDRTKDGVPWKLQSWSQELRA